MPRSFDSPWKETFDLFLSGIMKLLCPLFHARIDWTARYVALDVELRQVVRDSETGEMRVDRLYKVKAIGGGYLYLYIHIEIQAQVDPEFELRMFRSWYRLFDRFDQPIESLGILADENSRWRPNSYQAASTTAQVGFTFTTVKLLDLEDRLQELEQDENPVGLLVAAHLQSQRTHGKITERRAVKFRLIRGLLSRGLDAEQVRQFLRIVDWFLELPDTEERLFRNDLITWEKEQKMPCVMSFERFAAEERRSQRPRVYLGEALRC
jgi:hypothetical protein